MPQTEILKFPKNQKACLYPEDVYPNNLTFSEYQELAIGSAINEELIARGFFHLEGDTALDHFFISEKIPRLNGGRVTADYLKKYRHLEAGSIWISGLDPHNNWQPMEWGRFKPSQPRLDWKKAKPIKYESPPKVPNRVTYFDVPSSIWDRVAKRYQLKRYLSPLTLWLQGRINPVVFWEWVQKHPEIPIILTEGEKKAACLLSMGFVAIALPGIWNGRVGKKDFNERLHPDLVPLTQKGRKFTILFDYETKLNSRWAVYQATCRTGKAIEAIGCTCEVACLPGPEKGVDDFVVARDQQAELLLESILADAFSLADYQRLRRIRHRGLSRRYLPDVTVNVPYLSQAVSVRTDAANALSGRATDLVKFPESGLVVLDSDMGTGKTELVGDFRSERPNDRFLNNGHRVNLLKNLAERLQTEMYSALSHRDLVKATALSITVDSLYKLQTEANKYGCVFIDEACQYLAHLLHSKTCKEHRAEILEVLEYIVYNARLVVLADAHMDDITVDFFRAMRPAGEKPFIIKNEFKNGGRQIFWYEGQVSSALVAKIFAVLMAEQKVMVVSDSKRFIKKLEAAMTVRVVKDKAASDTVQTSHEPLSSSNSQFSQGQKLRVWSIHSENSGSEENIAFVKDISSEVKNIDALLASPSLGTGVDIPDYHFDAVFGAFHAVSLTATECSQSLYRYRPKVPIHIWVAPRPPYGYRETNATKIRSRRLEANEITAFLIRIDRETGIRGCEKDWALDAYCQIEAARNRSINNLRDDLRSLLEEMGNQIIPLGGGQDSQVSLSMKAAAQTLDLAHHQAVSTANNISATEYRARQSKDYLKPEEIFECEKFRIWDFYGMEVTPELVKKDDGGRLIKGIIQLEAILAESKGTISDPRTGREYPAPPKIVAERDLTERDLLPLCMDWGNYSAQWLARFNLGLHSILKRLVAGEEMSATDPELVRQTEIALQCAAHLKAILGFTVPANCRPMWLLATLVNQLGLKLTNRKQGPHRQQVRIYSLAPPELEFAQAVLSHRESKRQHSAALKREAQEKQAQHQARMLSQYGLEPFNNSISSPPPKRDSTPYEAGMDTKPNRPSVKKEAVDFDEDEAYSPPIEVCAQLLRSAIDYGAEAIRAILEPWSVATRWKALFKLEEIAIDRVKQLLELIPEVGF